MEVFAFTSGAMDEEGLAGFVFNECRFYQPDFSENMISRFRVQNLLAECPNLKSVCILGVYAEDENSLGTVISSKLPTLCLGSFWHENSFPDLAKAIIRVVAMDCRELTCVNFMHRYEGS